MDHNTLRIETETTSDERLLGMLAHLSILFGGLILPIILWVTQKDKSKFVTYNSLLAIFYHLSYVVLILIFVIIMIFAIIISGVGFGALENSSAEMPTAMIIIMIAFYIGLFGLIFAGIGYGVWLAIKTYQGKIVNIPFLGKIIHKKVYGDVPQSL
jgi:uncharacterized Tic20 family protein